MTFLEGALLVCGILLALAALGAVVRMIKGPALLDRVLAADVLLVVLAAGLIVDMVGHRTADHLALVVAITLIGFVGSVTVARFVQDRRRP